MRSKEDCLNVGFFKILCGFMMIMHCCITVSLADPIYITEPKTVLEVFIDEIVYLDAEITSAVYVYDGGTLNFLDDAVVHYMVAYDGSFVNIYGGMADLYGINVIAGSTVKVYGIGFEEDLVPVDYGEWTPSGGSGTLTGEYEYGDPTNPLDDISLLFYSYTPIKLIPPVEILIEKLIAAVKALNTKEGIVNNLDAKLQNALDALEAANAGQRQDAVNKMNAFINAVEAQSGKAISVEKANELVADAQQIIGLL